MSDYGENMTEKLHPGEKSRLQVFYQEDQSGFPGIRVTDVSYDFEETPEDLQEIIKNKKPLPKTVRKERKHYFLSQQEARELAVELLHCANCFDDPTLLSEK